MLDNDLGFTILLISIKLILEFQKISQEVEH